MKERLIGSMLAAGIALSAGKAEAQEAPTHPEEITEIATADNSRPTTSRGLDMDNRFRELEERHRQEEQARVQTENNTEEAPPTEQEHITIDNITEEQINRLQITEIDGEPVFIDSSDRIVTITDGLDHTVHVSENEDDGAYYIVDESGQRLYGESFVSGESGTLIFQPDGYNIIHTPSTDSWDMRREGEAPPEQNFDFSNQ